MTRAAPVERLKRTYDSVDKAFTSASALWGNTLRRRKNSCMPNT